MHTAVCFSLQKGNLFEKSYEQSTLSVHNSLCAFLFAFSVKEYVVYLQGQNIQYYYDSGLGNKR